MPPHRRRQRLEWPQRLQHILLWLMSLKHERNSPSNTNKQLSSLKLKGANVNSILRRTKCTWCGKACHTKTTVERFCECVMAASSFVRNYKIHKDHNIPAVREETFPEAGYALRSCNLSWQLNLQEREAACLSLVMVSLRSIL
ncbi:hypothetical protein EVAR_72725_1 [Eumeta japonica]|uniref:Uncharacterized protein n=1 Tax=Eumeta variegata TaxID=151549 RepID=A0A4C1SHC9_EUMVA|nr:hypothetical protein EVAR_72725_1 [Eumeta japonica]